MAQRETPQSYFQTSAQVKTQEPVQMRLETPPQVYYQPPAIDPNLTIAIIGIIAVVGVLGLFAVLASDRKCRC